MKVGIKNKVSGNDPGKRLNFGEKIAVLWHVTPCSLVDVLKRFGESASQTKSRQTA
jgi:hypothetical protein